MRSEKEMLELFRKTALTDENIRAAYIEGSRANPNVPKDLFQDYDVVYIVESTKPYRENKKWTDRFGENFYMNYPEDNIFYPSDVENCYGWQIQFTDGNRLDLHVCTKEYALANLEMYRVLVDKDQIMPAKEDTSEEKYWVQKPEEQGFACTCQNFWWCLNNVAKGMWRQEITYVMDMLDFALRPELMRMLEWKIGATHRFAVTPGKSGKYMKQYLSEEEYTKLLATYSAAEDEAIWKSVFDMCELFKDAAKEVSARLGFSYDLENEKNSMTFLKHVKDLPGDAEENFKD